MMTSLLYFDSDNLRRGNFFNLKSEIQAEEGHSYRA